jgi:hypothetical protein
VIREGGGGVVGSICVEMGERGRRIGWQGTEKKSGNKTERLCFIN